jgi:hypothetical protein
MRHIYNCEQISIPRAVSYNNMSDSSSQHIVLTTDSQHSSFDDTISSPTSKGQFDFSMKARLVNVVILIVTVFDEYFERNEVENDDFCFVFYRQRLELMREMYTNAADFSPTSPDRSIESLAPGEISSATIQADPFYDRFPWFRPIGR